MHDFRILESELRARVKKQEEHWPLRSFDPYISIQFTLHCVFLLQ